MSILAIAFPAEAAIPVAQSFAGTLAVLARSVLGLGVLGIFITLMMVFKPLITGTWRAVLLVVRPLTSNSGQRYLDRSAGVELLYHLAEEFEATQPNQAAELRWLASRD